MQVDFYCLTESADTARLQTACRLIAKAYDQKHHVHIHCKNAQEAHRLDELLWTFKEDSFIAHNFIGDGPDLPPPVRLGYDQLLPTSKDILVNLTDSIPEWHRQFQRILEIVINEPEQKEICRLHYRQYRALGYAQKTHNL